MPQVRVVKASPGRSLGLFGALSRKGGLDTEVNVLGRLLHDKSTGEGMRKGEEQNDGCAKLEIVAIDEESDHNPEENTEAEEAETVVSRRRGATLLEGEMEGGNSQSATSRQRITGSSPIANLPACDSFFSGELAQEELSKLMKATSESHSSSQPSKRSAEVC